MLLSQLLLLLPIASAVSTSQSTHMGKADLDIPPSASCPPLDMILTILVPYPLEHQADDRAIVRRHMYRRRSKLSYFTAKL